MDKTERNGFDSINWATVVLGVLGFWLSASLTLDALVVPSLAGSGMMDRSEFTSIGYGLFGTFNHLELLCAALVLSGLLALRQRASSQQQWQNFALAGILIAVTAISTYILTPQMGSMGASAAWVFENSSQTMVAMHVAYWSLEVCKFTLGLLLLVRCYRRDRASLAVS